MNDFSLVEKINILMDIINSSPLFLFCFVIGVAILIFFIICVKKNIKINKWIFIGAWILLALILIINYSDIFLKIIDGLFDMFFMILYFPNITVYITILLIINFSFIYSIISRKIRKINKIVNFVTTLITDLLLILIIDLIKTNNININDEITMFANSNLLVLLELTSAIFVSWLLILLLISAHKKLKKYDKKEYPKMPEIVFEEV